MQEGAEVQGKCEKLQGAVVDTLNSIESPLPDETVIFDPSTSKDRLKDYNSDASFQYWLEGQAKYEAATRIKAEVTAVTAAWAETWGAIRAVYDTDDDRHHTLAGLEKVYFTYTYLDELEATHLQRLRKGAAAPAPGADVKLIQAALKQQADAAAQQEWHDIGKQLLAALQAKQDVENLHAHFASTDNAAASIGNLVRDQDREGAKPAVLACLAHVRARLDQERVFFSREMQATSARIAALHAPAAGAADAAPAPAPAPADVAAGDAAGNALAEQALGGSGEVPVPQASPLFGSPDAHAAANAGASAAAQGRAAAGASADVGQGPSGAGSGGQPGAGARGAQEPSAAPSKFDAGAAGSSKPPAAPADAAAATASMQVVVDESAKEAAATPKPAKSAPTRKPATGAPTSAAGAAAAAGTRVKAEPEAAANALRQPGAASMQVLLNAPQVSRTNPSEQCGTSVAFKQAIRGVLVASMWQD